MRYDAGHDWHDSTSGAPRGVAFPRFSPAVKWLIIVTVAMFVVQIYFRSAQKIDLSRTLGVMPRAVVERLHVWQVFTYMFLHSTDSGHIIHIVINMLFVYWFGTELDRMLGRGRFLTLYLGGGLAGGIAYAVTQYFVGMKNPAIGASAAVMAILVVYALYFPDRTVYLFFSIPMKVKWFVAGVIAIDLAYSTTAYADGVAHTAHLGGALFGLLYWRLRARVERFFDGWADRHRDRAAQSNAADEKRLDDILSKIHRDGFDSLSSREREFLVEQSRRRRDRGYRG